MFNYGLLANKRRIQPGPECMKTSILVGKEIPFSIFARTAAGKIPRSGSVQSNIANETLSGSNTDYLPRSALSKK
jgi:hypothetical protein